MRGMIVLYILAAFCAVGSAIAKGTTSSAVLSRAACLVMAIALAAQWVINELRQMIREQRWNAAVEKAKTDSRIVSTN
jgi:hypothetical protein